MIRCTAHKGIQKDKTLVISLLKSGMKPLKLHLFYVFCGALKSIKSNYIIFVQMKDLAVIKAYNWIPTDI